MFNANAMNVKALIETNHFERNHSFNNTGLRIKHVLTHRLSNFIRCAIVDSLLRNDCSSQICVGFHNNRQVALCYIIPSDKARWLRLCLEIAEFRLLQ